MERVKDLGVVYLAGWLHLDPYPLLPFYGDMKTNTALQGCENVQTFGEMYCRKG